jgi:hypothetical protein
MKSPKDWLSLRRQGEALLLANLFLCALTAYSQDATWLAAPSTSDWNTAAKWTPATVPTGTATFGTSTNRSLTFSLDTTVGTLQFNAASYSFEVISHQLTITGSGVEAIPANASTFDVRASSPALKISAASAARPSGGARKNRRVYVNAAEVTDSSGGALCYPSGASRRSGQLGSQANLPATPLKAPTARA